MLLNIYYKRRGHCVCQMLDHFLSPTPTLDRIKYTPDRESDAAQWHWDLCLCCDPWFHTFSRQRRMNPLQNLQGRVPGVMEEGSGCPSSHCSTKTRALEG